MAVRVVVGPWSRSRDPNRRSVMVTVRDDSEVSFRPVVRVAVALDIVNLTCKPVQVEPVELEAVFSRGWSDRFKPLLFEAFQVNGRLIAALDNGRLPPVDIPAGASTFMHFLRLGLFELDALLHFRYTLRIAGQRRQRVRFHATDTYAASIAQSTVHVVRQLLGIPGGTGCGSYHQTNLRRLSPCSGASCYLKCLRLPPWCPVDLRHNPEHCAFPPVSKRMTSIKPRVQASALGRWGRAAAWHSGTAWSRVLLTERFNITGEIAVIPTGARLR